jgi:hypothetical protein
MPESGAVLHLDRAASVQFAGARAITVEVLRVLPRPLFEGWVWLEVRVLDPPVPAAEVRREVFVQRAAIAPPPAPPASAR